MSTVALVFELVSHVAYVPAIAVALYGARGQMALAFSYTILFSLHYHVCLDSPVCITTLARAGALDYVAGIYSGAVMSHHLTGVPHDSVSMSLMTIMYTLFAIFDDLYLNYWAFALVTGILFLQIFVLQPLFGLRSVAYRNPGLQPLIVAVLAVAYVLIALPLKPKSFWYNGTHPLWHVASGIASFLYTMVAVRPVVVKIDSVTRLKFSFKLRDRRIIIAEATRMAPASELLPENRGYVGSA